MKKILLCIILIWSISTLSIAVDVYERQSMALNLDELEKQGVDVEITSDISLNDGLKMLFERARDEVYGIFSASTGTIGVIFAIAVLSTILSGISDNGLKTVPSYVTVAAALAICASAAGSINSFIRIGTKTIEDMDTFSKTLMPTLAASVAATGSPFGATARYSASLIFSNVIMSLIKSLLIPLIYAYISAACVSATIKNATVDKIADFLNTIISATLKTVLTIFVAYITLTGFVASTGDVAGAKTISTVSGMIPVVGKILSGATDVVISGAKIIKNSIGIFGILSVLSICLTPFLQLAVNYISFKLASVILAPVCDSKISEFVGRIGTSFGTMLAICASCAFLLFISILSCMFALGLS